MWRYYVYIHRKASDGAPFYVGKGAVRARHKVQTFERSKDRVSRNKAWLSTVAEHGVTVEIVMSCQTDAEAQEQEARLIAEIGRIDLRQGPLVNLTDGGEGHAGIIVSDELRRKRSINSRGPRSPEWIASIRASRKNGGNGGVVKSGDKLPASWVANISAAKMGDKNPQFGKIGARAKKVRNAITGAVYDSIDQAAAAEGLNPKTLYQYLDGTRLNKTPLMRVSDGVLV